MLTTAWDKIYQDYQQGGNAWATLSEDIHPLFLDLLGNAQFSVKHALDIGCGTGKYLAILQSSCFAIEGIDSSPTAVAMCKQALGEGAIIQCTNMFDYAIRSKTYDLIVSVSTLHHGMKEQVQAVIDNISQALVTGGYAFVTLPDFETSERQHDFSQYAQLADKTFTPLTGPEKGLAHSYYSLEEVKELFDHFSQVEVDLDTIGRWVIRARND